MTESLTAEVSSDPIRQPKFVKTVETLFVETACTQNDMLQPLIVRLHYDKFPPKLRTTISEVVTLAAEVAVPTYITLLLSVMFEAFASTMK